MYNEMKILTCLDNIVVGLKNNFHKMINVIKPLKILFLLTCPPLSK